MFDTLSYLWLPFVVGPLLMIALYLFCSQLERQEWPETIVVLIQLVICAVVIVTLFVASVAGHNFAVARH